MATTGSLVLKLENLPSRGRALIASQAILPGQVLLHESPILIYLDAQSASSNFICFHCSRPNPSSTKCSSCQAAYFCSPACASASSSTSHTPFVCKSLSFLALCTLDWEAQTQARFLIAAYNLAVIAPQAFQQLLLLEGEGVVDERVRILHTFLSEVVRSAQHGLEGLPSWSVSFVASLLAKDQRNAFGLSTFTSDPSERQVRAYAIYAQASFLNHDCLPNACRFDYINKPGVGTVDIIIRSLHEISEGSEVCISYFPVNWPLAERRKKLKDEYGFDCDCERCKIEETWSVDETGEQRDDISVEEENMADEDMQNDEEDGEEGMDADADGDGNFPHAMFFIKYVCPHEGCGGTLAPLPPTDTVSTFMECNVCGQLRSEEEFLQEIEEHKIED